MEPLEVMLGVLLFKAFDLGAWAQHATEDGGLAGSGKCPGGRDRGRPGGLRSQGSKLPKARLYVAQAGPRKGGN